jgi:probable rRNA maturation factor
VIRREVSLRARIKKPAIKAEPLVGFMLDLMRELDVSGSVSVEIRSESAISALNSRYRHRKGPTDVLAFADGEADETGLCHLGDIVICAKVAKANARALGHSFEEELRRLLLHGLLHLCGYDHEADNGRMARKERALCRKMGLPE